MGIRQLFFQIRKIVEITDGMDVRSEAMFADDIAFSSPKHVTLACISACLSAILHNIINHMYALK